MGSPQRVPGLTLPHDRSSDAKTGQYPLTDPATVPIHSPAFLSTDWQLWTAATLTDETLRTTMITLVKKYASSELNGRPFPDWYDSETGEMSTFENRVVVGGHFALVRRLMPPLWGVRGLTPLVFSSSLCPMSKGRLPTAVVAAVAMVVEAMVGIVVAQQLPLQPYPRH